MRKIMAVLAGIALMLGLTATPALASGTYYYYAGGESFPASGVDGVAAAFDVANPQLNTVHDYHTLAELALRDTSKVQTVELGWTKSAAECPNTTSPCLFVFRWDNGVAKGYNTAGGFVKCNGTNGCAIPTYGVGQSIPVGLYTFAMVHIGTWPTGTWWASVQASTWTSAQYLGYWNDSLWSSAGPAFGKAYDVLGFGEVASMQQYPTASPCSAMGNGNPGSNGNASPTPARIANLTWIGNTVDPQTWTLYESSNIPGQPTTPYYSYGQLLPAGGGTWSGRSLTYGGDNTSC